jgi:putative ABC transport system permease protein
MGLTGERKQVHLFSLLAFFILIIACINFTNLSTAASIKRAQEIGMRKVLGAERKQLISQFLTESLFISFLAMIIGLFVVLAVLPAFNDISGKSFSWRYLDLIFYAGILIISIFTGLISGIYPALFLSSLLPVRILKKGFRSNRSQIYLKNFLVVFQFSISLILIISTLVINKQLKYLRNRNPGFNKEHILKIPWGVKEELKEELLKIPQVANLSNAMYSPSNIFALFNLKWATKDSIRSRQMWGTSVDSDYLDLFGIDLLQGRNFRKGSENDELTGLIVNETAVSQMELEESIGKEITFSSSNGIKDLTIIGVIRDHNFRDYYKAIEPLIILNDPVWCYTSFIKIKPDNISETIVAITKTMKDYHSYDGEIDYSFLDDEFNETYKMEIKKNQLFNYFTVLAILISCLGLFGLAAFMVEQRTKEIGIRKVHGSSVNQIVYFLSKDFVKWVAYANIFAIPVSIYFLKNWLQNFAFRISLDIWFFIIASFLTLLIALLSVLSLSIKAASANPVKSLKYE